jgi:endonuclease-3
MATTINKQRVLTQLLSAAPKVDSPAEDRPVLEQFIYGLCRENATPDQAEQAYQLLRSRFFDWNEIRVSSARELEEVFEGMSGPELRSQRLISFLQEVFETTFSFDLETLHKKGLKNSAKALDRYQSANDYVTSWVVQRSLGGHAIPLDPAMLRCGRRLGLIDDNHNDLEAARASLEHSIPKAKGLTFCDALGQVANEVCHENEPNCPACPVARDCAYAQEQGGEAAAVGAPVSRPRSR